MACFASDHDDPIGGEATFALDAPGRFDGYLGWFVATDVAVRDDDERSMVAEPHRPLVQLLPRG